MGELRVHSYDLTAEVDRHFDDSSLTHGRTPRIEIIMGGVAVGKTTMRRRDFAVGFVTVDAGDIFISMSRGHYIPFPDALEEGMELIGNMVARRAVAERRNIVMELIGAEIAPVEALLTAMKGAGYQTKLHLLQCDIEEAQRRNLARSDDNISCFFAESYHRGWLIDAAKPAPSPPPEPAPPPK